jgi:glutathione S-transferase
MLAFKGVKFETVYVPYHDKRELIRETGQDYVPALKWDGKFVAWFDIPEFLERKVKQPTLYPKLEGGLAKVVENWGHAVLEERVWRAVVTEVPPVLRDDHERWVFEEMQTRARGPWHILESRKAEFEKEMVEHLEMVEKMLDGRKWILGQPSVADFGVYGGMSPVLTVGRKLPASMKGVRAWAGRIAALGA